MEKPTFKQAQKLAKVMHVPMAYFYLHKPPEEKLPIPDLRTVEGSRIVEPSLNLRDVVKEVIQRQEWYKDYLKLQGEEELPFVGRFTVRDDVGVVVNDIRETLGLERPRAGTWDEYFRLLIERVESAGILVMRSGVAGNNTHRKLDVSEFRGFAIADKNAPAVFINSADAPTARLFTFIHELAHIWIGSSGVSDMDQVSQGNKEEVFVMPSQVSFLFPSRS
ncbi:ImmA/IrrE family metallo-endopeptidase [Oceanimonas sp. NS1]|nr:ImmA/IrrE family metallo-endopeptidase [Oceanimonas sp. NS1]